MARFNKIYKKTILSAVVLFFVFLIQGCAPTFYYEGSQYSSLENASNARSAVLESIIDQTKGGAFQAESTLKIIFPNSNLIKQKGILKNDTNLNQQQQAELVTLTAFVSESIQKELEAIIKIIERSQLFKTVEHKAGEFTISPEFDNADFILVAVFPTNQPALDKRFATSNSRMEWYLQARGSKRKIQIDYNQSIKIKERLGQFVSNLTKAVKRNFDDKLLSEKILASQKKSKAEAVTGPQDMDPPEISMLSTIIVKEAKPTIKGKVTDASKIVRVTVDEKPIELSSDGSFSFRPSVSIKGAKVKVEVIDEWGNRSRKVVSLIREQEKKVVKPPERSPYPPLDPTKDRVRKNPEAVALIIGITNYKNITSSEYSSSDAKKFAAYARRKLGVPESRIKLMRDQQASIYRVQEELENWLQEVIKPRHSDIYIFFSGHGMRSKDGQDVLLLPSDFLPNFPSKTSFSRHELFSMLSSAKARSVTIFLDTSYTGLSRNGKALFPGTTPNPKKQSIPDGITVFSAAGIDQEAHGLDRVKQGLFSYYLMKGMEGLADKNRDQRITAEELHRYILANVSRVKKTQTPILEGNAKRTVVSK